MTFGYTADMAFSNTTATILDHAKYLLGSLLDERESDKVCQLILILRWNR